MNIYRSLASLPHTPTVATIGNFDGVHLGHRWVIDQVNARARALSQSGPRVSSLVITFEPHPIRVLRPGAPHSLITPLPEKLALLATTGIDATLVLPFTPELSRLSPEDFARQVLCDSCCVREVHEGETFRFGYGASADMHSLADLGRKLNFGVHHYSPVIVRGSPVSSSRVRGLIASGEVAHARPLLGRPFSILSTPARGRGYGTRYAVPTINLAPYTELLPANGVYITTLYVGSGPARECFEAVTNVGNRPTFGPDSFAVESHLLDFHPIDLTQDTPLELTFLKRLRTELRFPSPEALREQIGRDVRRATRYFGLARCLLPNLPRAGDTVES